MTDQLESILQKQFHFKHFRSGQKEAIEAVLARKDCLVMLPTGTGKSVCYQLPSYLQEGLTIIVSPLLSLMRDQVEAIKQRGEKRVASLTSEHHPRVQQRILKQVSHLRYLFLSPEMLRRSDVIDHLCKQKINLLAIDEAHCISEWGLDFRPDYLALGQLREQLNYPVTMALTATATPKTRQEIKDVLRMDSSSTKEIVYRLDRPEIKWHVEKCLPNQKDSVLLDIVQTVTGPTIIYFMSKKDCERIAHYLTEKTDRTVAYYHSGVRSEDKVIIQEKFRQDDLDLICATSAFGMGIDKQNIRTVIHYHLPASPEMYLQEVGRACRDGEDGLAILLYSSGDEQFQAFVQQESLPSLDMIQYVYQQERKQINADQPQMRLIARYQSVGIAEREAYHMIQNRYRIKQFQLRALMDYVHAKDCLRQTLLDYFSEEKIVTEQLCCSRCDPKLIESVVEDFSSLEEGRNKSSFYLTWQEKMEKLYGLQPPADL